MVAYAALDEGCGLSKDLIPHAVPELVVVGLEPVDVEQQQRDGEAHRVRLLDDRGEEMPKVARVVQAGQIVRDRQLLQSHVAVFQRRDLADDHRELRQKMPCRVFIFIAREHQVQRRRDLVVDPHRVGQRDRSIRHFGRLTAMAQIRDAQRRGEALVDLLDRRRGTAVRVLENRVEHDLGQRQARQRRDLRRRGGRQRRFIRRRRRRRHAQRRRAEYLAQFSG